MPEFRNLHGTVLEKRVQFGLVLGNFHGTLRSDHDPSPGGFQQFAVTGNRDNLGGGLREEDMRSFQLDNLE